MSRQTVSIEGRELSISNLGKVLYPETGFTKGQVIDYYARIAPALLPHLAGRPLTLKRYPEGVDKPFFFQKECPDHRPDWVSTAGVWPERDEGAITFCVVDRLPALVWVANLASLELHTSLSRADDMSRPTVMVFDLDPGPGAGLAECSQVALRLRDLLASLNLESFVKSSGGKGLHAYVPLNSNVPLNSDVPSNNAVPSNSDVGYTETKPIAQGLAQFLERETPDRVTSNMSKSQRAGRVFIDWSQNDEKKTTASVYSLRARPRPTVSAPLTWDEVARVADGDDPSLLVFEAPQAVERFETDGDLFAPVLSLVQRLPEL